MKEDWVLLYFVQVYDPELRDLINISDFKIPAYQFLFKALSVLLFTYKQLPSPEIVLNKFKEVATGRLTPEEVQDVLPFFENWSKITWNDGDFKYIRDEILKWIKKRHAEQMLHEATELVNSGSVDKLPSLFRPLSSIESDSQVLDQLSSLDKRFDEWQILRQRRGISIPFELGMFKTILPKEVGLILAPPKIGKSFVLTWCGAHAIVVNQAKVVHFTLEMTGVDVGMRYDLMFTNQFGGNPERITNETYFQNRETIRKYLNTFLQSSRLKIVDIPSNKATTSYIESKYEQICDREGTQFDLIILDYANLVKSIHIKDASKLYSVGTDIFEWLHDFAKSYNVAIWTVARSTRDAMKIQESNQLKNKMKSRIRGSHVGHSYAIIYDCDHILTLSDLTRFEEGVSRSNRIFELSLDYSRRCSSFYGYQVELFYPTAMFFSPPISKVESASQSTAQPYTELTQ